MDGWFHGHFFDHCLADLAVAADVLPGPLKGNTGNESCATDHCTGNQGGFAAVDLVRAVYGDGHAIGVVFDSDVDLGHSECSRNRYGAAGGM